MALTDLFSHKIHASGPKWDNRLCLIAAIFSKYSGKCFESCRDALINDFSEIAPRVSATRTNPSWRDELTAYVSHLGVARFRRTKSNAWVIETTGSTRKFLLGEAPDVAAFLRMQLPLLQFPNAMGIRPKGRGSVAPNALGKTWEFVKAGIRVSPVRLITAALKADANLRAVDLFEAETKVDEIYALANHPEIYCQVLPAEDVVCSVLEQVRAGKIAAPPRDPRFHLLNYMQVFSVTEQFIRFRPRTGDADAQLLRSHVDTMASCSAYFKNFDDCTSEEELKREILSGSWGQYFDAMKHLSGDEISSLGRDETTEHLERGPVPDDQMACAAPLRNLTDNLAVHIRKEEDSPERVFADPEVTRIKKERRNVAHELMVVRLRDWLKDEVALCTVGDSKLIDLWAKLPDGRVFIFEIKSGGEGIWEQIRKGVSQLYEYRYRYALEMDDFKDAHLCLVLPEDSPGGWMPDYLCLDRDINLCLISMRDNVTPPGFHGLCSQKISARKLS